MKKLDPTTKNKIYNLILTAKKERNALIIKERDKFFAERNVKEILKAYPCKGILIKSTQAGIAYTTDKHINQENQPIDNPDHEYGNDLIYATAEKPSDETIYQVIYKKGVLITLGVIGKGKTVQQQILIQPTLIESIKQL